MDEWPEGLYEAEVRVAAFQNGYFVALCNRVGAEECLTFGGESFVCAPDGRVVARAARLAPAILHAEINLREAAESHARRLFMRDRRPDLYAAWVGSDAHLRHAVLAIAALSASVVGCRNIDVLTNSYADLEEARAAGAVSAGYLPEGLPPGTADIREAHDTKSSRRWALFTFPPGEGNAVRALVEPQETSTQGQICDVPARIEWWPVLLRNTLDAERMKATGLQTYRSRSGDSIYAVNWSQGRAYAWTMGNAVGEKEDVEQGSGAEDWNRTSDTSIFSAVLYRLSYLGTRNRVMQNPNHTSARFARTSPQARACLLQQAFGSSRACESRRAERSVRSTPGRRVRGLVRFLSRGLSFRLYFFAASGTFAVAPYAHTSSLGGSG